MIGPMVRILAGATLVGLTVGVSAQQAWIVDPNGTGHFSDLHAAIAFANPGDTLLMRNGGDYAGTYTIDKSIALVRQSGTVRIERLAVGNPSGSVSVSVVGVGINDALVYGPASLEGVRMPGCDVLGGNVMMHRCNTGGLTDLYTYANRDGLSVSAGANLVFSDGVANGGAGSWWMSGLGGCVPLGSVNAINVYGTLSVSGSTVAGAPSQFVCWSPPGNSAPSHGISAHGGTVRITRSTIRGGSLGTSPIQATGASIVEYDPSVQFAPPWAQGTTRFLPATGGDGVAPGSTMPCRAVSDPNLPAALVASIGLHAPTALPQGIAWIDPSAFVVLVIGFTDGGGVLNASIPIPVLVPRGLPVTVQSVVADGAAGPLVAGVPAVLHVL